LRRTLNYLVVPLLTVMLAGCWPFTWVEEPAPEAGGKVGPKIGIVLMHGKGGTARARSPVGPLKSALQDAGFAVIAPDMPWHRERIYEKSLDDSMTEIDEAVEWLKDGGATKIVVGGHSLGANAAIAYGARRQGLAGILAIAPGHIPEIGFWASSFAGDVARAKKMVAEGRGDEEADFADLNQGRNSSLPVKASVYLSWFDPNGPAVMPKNAANLKPGTALYWFVGEDDRMATRGRAYAFEKAPPNPKSSYVVVSGGHKTAIVNGIDKIVKWLKSL